jgi:uncharacterized protein YndB with AHSA1/START domain
MTQTDSHALTVTVISDLEIAMTRVFDAPRDLVYQAHVKPEHVRQWWGQKGSTLSVCEVDLRVGGAWRFVEKAADGNEYGFHGEYREIDPPERLVYTFEFEGMPGHVTVDHLTFVEQDGKTVLNCQTTFASKEDRDGMLASGMEQGAGESYDRLEEYLASMA